MVESNFALAGRPSPTNIQMPLLVGEPREGSEHILRHGADLSPGRVRTERANLGEHLIFRCLRSHVAERFAQLALHDFVTHCVALEVDASFECLDVRA